MKKNEYTTTFQSRVLSKFNPWLEPYTDIFLSKLAKKGIKNVAIVTPAFVSDCLETLEEIKIQYDELFRENGGEKLHYIPCLNDHDDHITLIDKLIKDNMGDWFNEK